MSNRTFDLLDDPAILEGVSDKADRETIAETILGYDKGEIEIRSYAGHAGAHSRLNRAHRRQVEPVWDPTNMRYKGVEPLSEELKNSGRAYVDPEDPENPLGRIVLEHGKRFDLSNPNHKLVLRWLFHCRNTLALTHEEGRLNPKQTFYVYNKATDINRRTQRYKIKDTAISLLNQTGTHEIRSVARVMGFNMPNASPEDIMLHVRELFEDKGKGFEYAAQFVKAVNDPLKKAKEFVFAAYDKGLITKDARGEYYFNEEYLGNTFDKVVSKLTQKDVESKRRLMYIQEKLNELMPSVSVYEEEKFDNGPSKNDIKDGTETIDGEEVKVRETPKKKGPRSQKKK